MKSDSDRQLVLSFVVLNNCANFGVDRLRIVDSRAHTHAPTHAHTSGHSSTDKKLLLICEPDLNFLDFGKSPNKSFCSRIGPRYNYECSNLCTKSGNEFHWVSEIRYLGNYIQAAKRFKGGFDHAKRSFFRTFNAIYGKVGSNATEDVILQLTYSKCLPSLLYDTEALPIFKAAIRSLEFTYNRILFKVFKTRSILFI
jgi:hypothetical protein